MSSAGNVQSRKRSKAFYRKSAHGGKRHCPNANVLCPGIRGFLVMCHANESTAVKETYNILNEYADEKYGQGLSGPKSGEEIQSIKNDESPAAGGSGEDDEDCVDVEKAVKKEVEGLKNQPSEERRFQNCATNAKNCVFIRTTVENPVDLVLTIMKDIASKKLTRARYAARILPIVGTCKAHGEAIEKLAKNTLASLFSPQNPDAPNSFTVIFKSRNNSGTTGSRTSSIAPMLINTVREINPGVQFSWSDFEVAILVEIVAAVCCLGIAPQFTTLRKYNLQELAQGPKISLESMDSAKIVVNEENIYGSKERYCDEENSVASHDNNEVEKDDVVEEEIVVTKKLEIDHQDNKVSSGQVCVEMLLDVENVHHANAANENPDLVVNKEKVDEKVGSE